MIPGDGAGRITHRTDGVVHDLVPEIPAARMENRNAFSDMAGVNGYELMQRSKGAEISVSVRTTAGQRQRKALRFHGRRSLYGRAIVIRINPSDFFNFDQMGIEPSQQEVFQRALGHRHGVILVTGATGSGKSNTLEAMLESSSTIITTISTLFKSATQSNFQTIAEHNSLWTTTTPGQRR